MKIGIDFGTSHTKIIGLKETGEAITTRIPTKNISRKFLDQAIQSIPNDEEITEIFVTGGNISFFPDEFMDAPIIKISEWDALYNGIDKLHPNAECILINIGSGVSIHIITNETRKHIGGSALGTTIIDRFKEYFEIYSPIPDLEELSTLHSSVGDLVDDLDGLKPEWPGVYFNKMTTKTLPEDIISALEQVVADQIMNLGYLYAKTTLHDSILITGGGTLNHTIQNRIKYWGDDHDLTLLMHNWNPFLSLIGLVGLPNSIEIK